MRSISCVVRTTMGPLCPAGERNMKLALLTYLVLTMPGVANFLITLFMLAALAWVIAGLASADDALDGKLRPAWRSQTRHLKWMIPVFALCVLMPSKDDAKVI